MRALHAITVEYAFAARLIAAAALIAFFSGCSGKFKSSLQFNPNSTLRIAVLPFHQIDKENNVVSADESLLIDRVSLVSTQLKQTPAEFVQRQVEQDLEQTAMDLISPAFVSAQLLHSGYGMPELGQGFNHETIRTTQHSKLCSLLGADALLTGKVTKWERTYLAIQSISEVGIALELRSCNGEPLFIASGEDSTGRGLSKIPTGFSDLLIEPIRGLSNDIITDLAAEVVTETLAPLFVQNRPDYLNSAPPVIFASAHDAFHGDISAQGSLQVVVYGSSGKTGYFSIGDQIENLALFEREPGHYSGQYYPLPTDSFEDQKVSVYLADKFGKTTKQVIGTATVSLKRGNK